MKMHQLILNLRFLQELCLRQDDEIIGYITIIWVMIFPIKLVIIIIIKF